MNTLVSYAEKNAVKLTQPEKNLLNKLEEKYGVKLESESTESLTVANRMSGETAKVSPLVAKLTEFIYGCSNGFLSGLSYRGAKVTVSDFDRTRYLVLKLDSNAYGSLID